MSNKDIEAIKEQGYKTPEEILQELFDYDCYLEPKGKAFVWVDYQGTDGRSYGRFRLLSEAEYQSHTVRVSQSSTRHINVHILDTLYDPETKEHIPEEV